MGFRAQVAFLHLPHLARSYREQALPCSRVRTSAPSVTPPSAVSNLGVQHENPAGPPT